jgi:hypothetical protein
MKLSFVTFILAFSGAVLAEYIEADEPVKMRRDGTVL